VTPTITNTPEFFAPVVPAIPTLSGLGLALMVILLLGIAVIYLGRQRQ
jgi:hypothetical protein